MVKLQLKPIVGAFAAITLYILLSWGVVSGIDVTNGGTYLSLALLAGFSERYLLRLLRGIDEPEERGKDSASSHSDRP
jgi:hypothetical protein